MKKGLFITFEGIDGCGKSTQVGRVADLLRRDGIDIEVTREPGGTAIAEAIRGVVMSSEHREMCTECEVLLYLAARAQHVQERILPALKRGALVLCDRFADATFAYQGYGRGVDLAALKRLNRYAAAGLVPDCTMLFDLPVETAWQRMAGMKKQLDRLESGPRRFHERIRRGYRTLAREAPRRFFMVNATQSIETLTGIVYDEIKKRNGHRSQ